MMIGCYDRYPANKSKLIYIVLHKLGLFDVCILVFYMILCFVVAFKNMGKIRNIKEYAMGGAFSTRVLAATFFATFTGAGPILGYIEKIHEVGLLFALAIILEPITWFTTSKILSNNIEYFKAKGCMSVSDIMQVLYGSSGKWVCNVLSIGLSIGTIAVQIKAIGYLSEYFIGLPEVYGAVMGFAIVVAYSFFGGIRAVIFTDVLQSLVFLVGIPIACFTAYYTLGGYTELINNIPQKHKVLEMSQSDTIMLISCLLCTLIPFSGLAFVQRFLIAKDSVQLRAALHHTFLIAIPFYFIIILTGFITVASLPAMESKLAFYELVTNNLPLGVKGLVIAGLLAAIMSTADSYLNSASVMFAHNIAKPLFPSISPRIELWLAKLATLIFSAISLWMTFMGGNLIELMWLSENFWTPFVVVPLLAGFLKFYTNTLSFVGSLIIAFFFLWLGKYISGEFGIVSAFLGIIGSAIGLIVAHKLQQLPVSRTQDI